MLVRYSLVLAVLFLFIDTANAQVKRKGVTPIQRGTQPAAQKISDYSLSQLQGKWQEYKRMDRNNNAMGFTDSIQLNFTDSNKVQTRTSLSNSMTMNGEADIDGDNNLTVAADTYTIKSLSKNELTLNDDDNFIHHLKRVDEYWYETLGKLSVKQDSYTITVTVPITRILGKWSVYKRQAKPGVTTSNMHLIKYLNITAKTSDSTATGDMTYFEGQSAQQTSCTIALNGSNIKIVAGQNKWDLSIYQADADNFIFGSEALLYFSKAEH